RSGARFGRLPSSPFESLPAGVLASVTRAMVHRDSGESSEVPMTTERLIVVSGDSHATLHPDSFPDYVEAKYQDLLPAVYEDNAVFSQLFGSFANFPPEVLEVIEGDGVWASGGVSGAWDAERLIVEMDREGVAAEMIFPGDARFILPLVPMLRRYPQDVVAAG